MSIVFLSDRFDPAIHFADEPEVEPDLPVDQQFIEVRDFSFFYPGFQALDSVTMAIPSHRVTALIGPSGSGKTTMLRCFNRMNDFIPGCRHAGDIAIAGQSIFGPGMRPISLRRSVGLVFQKPNPLPHSIFENVACGIRATGEAKGREVAERVESCLVQAALWDEVKDRLDESALALSGGQMQRLCIARALACRPEILLLDEPCSSLDPVAATRIENLIADLSRELTVVLVTHNLGQAARCADYVGFFYKGKLVECGPGKALFIKPAQQLTLEYLGGTVW